jgi:hypothetical protein
MRYESGMPDAASNDDCGCGTHFIHVLFDLSAPAVRPEPSSGETFRKRLADPRPKLVLGSTDELTVRCSQQKEKFVRNQCFK